MKLDWVGNKTEIM